VLSKGAGNSTARPLSSGCAREPTRHPSRLEGEAERGHWPNGSNNNSCGTDSIPKLAPHLLARDRRGSTLSRLGSILGRGLAARGRPRASRLRMATVTWGGVTTAGRSPPLTSSGPVMRATRRPVTARVLTHGQTHELPMPWMRPMPWMERTRGSARSLWPARALSPTPARPMCGGADRNGPPWDAGARATSRARRVLAKGVLRHRPRPRSHLSRKAVGAVDSRGGRALRAVWMNHGARFIGAIRLSVSGSGPRPGNAEVWSMFHVEHTPGILPPASRFPLGSRTLVPVPDPVLMAPTANEFAGRRAGRCARPALAPCPLEGWVRVVCVRVSRRAPVGRVATIDLSVPGGELGAAGAARAEAVPSPTPP